jgi:hypothetical protein
MDSSFPLPSPPPAAVVLENLPCRNCSYNLRTLPTTGTCPECGSPVADSLHRDLLRGSSPFWLKTIRFGTRVVIWATVATFILYSRVMNGSRMWTYIGVGYIPLVALAAGLWIVTAANQAWNDDEKDAVLRRAIRALAISWPMQAFIVLFVQEFPSLLKPDSREFLTVVLGALQCVSMILFLVYVRRLALRIPDNDIASGLTRAAWGYALIAGSMSIFSLVSFWRSLFLLSGQFFGILTLAYIYLQPLQIVAMVIFVQALSPFATALARESRR